MRGHVWSREIRSCSVDDECCRTRERRTWTVCPRVMRRDDEIGYERSTEGKRAVGHGEKRTTGGGVLWEIVFERSFRDNGSRPTLNDRQRGRTRVGKVLSNVRVWNRKFRTNSTTLLGPSSLTSGKGKLKNMFVFGREDERTNTSSVIIPFSV